MIGYINFFVFTYLTSKVLQTKRFYFCRCVIQYFVSKNSIFKAIIINSFMQSYLMNWDSPRILLMGQFYAPIWSILNNTSLSKIKIAKGPTQIKNVASRFKRVKLGNIICLYLSHFDWKTWKMSKTAHKSPKLLGLQQTY